MFCFFSTVLIQDAPHMAVAAALILNESELVVCAVCDVINQLFSKCAESP